MTARLAALLVLIGVAIPATAAPLTGVQPLIVLYAPSRTPLQTVAQIQASTALNVLVWSDASRGAYTFTVQTFGPFQMPYAWRDDGRVSAQQWGVAAEAAAQAAGVVFPAGVQPVVVWDRGHTAATYVSSIPGAKRGLIDDGKRINWLIGLTLAFSVQYAQVIPPFGTNAFDPYSIMGYMGRGTTAAERWQKGWLQTTEAVFDNADAPPTLTSRFIETLEIAPRGGVKYWRLANLVEIEVRNLAQAGIGKPTRQFVSLSRYNTRLDLDTVTLLPTPCRWYQLAVGQIYTVGDGIGIRTDSLAIDGSGATVTVFPYTGQSTARCTTGSK